MHSHACTPLNHINVITIPLTCKGTLSQQIRIWFTCPGEHTRRHTPYINQTKSFSTTWWCHCAAIIHPSGSSGQHRSVSHCCPPPPVSEDSWANQGWWVFMNNAHIDSSAHMKMDSWPILTCLLKKKQHSTPLRSLQAEVSRIITQCRYSGRDWGLLWLSSLILQQKTMDGSIL